MRTIARAGLIVLYVAAAPHAVGADDDAGDAAVSALELAKRVEQRFAQYDNLEFTYRVTTESSPSPEAQETRQPAAVGEQKSIDVYRIYRPDQAEGRETARPMRCWIRRITFRDWEPILDRFAAFDGATTRHYQRRYYFGGDDVGRIVPGEDWTAFHENVFEQFLLLRVNGICAATDANDEFGLFNIDSYKVAETNVTDGRRVYRLHAKGVEGGPAFDDVVYNVEVTDDQGPVVTLWEAKDTRLDRWLSLYKVDEIKQFGGVPYPASGSFRQQAIGELPNHHYEFEVLSVKRIPANTIENWRPEFPLGTRVKDATNTDSDQ